MLVRNGHRENDVIWNYSIEKAHRYCEDVVALELEDRRNTAIDMYYAISAATPIETKDGNRKRIDNWKKHLESLDLKEQKRQEDRKKKDPFGPLRGIVPFA